MSDRDPELTIEPEELIRLHGATVLVEARHDQANPPVALRGTVEARPDEAGRPTVKIILEYPDMFTHPAARGVIDLNGAEVADLMASNRDGVLRHRVDEIRDPGLEPPGPQAVS